MQIVVTYEAADLLRLIEQDLTKKGLSYDPSAVAFKGKPKIVVQVSVEDSLSPTESATPSTITAPVEIVVSPEPLDLDEILHASKALERDANGKLPKPTRTYMHGETDEFPGVPNTRGR